MFHLAPKKVKNSTTVRATLRAKKSLRAAKQPVAIHKASYHASQANLGMFSLVRNTVAKWSNANVKPHEETRYAGPTTGWVAQLEDVPFEVKAPSFRITMPRQLKMTDHVARNRLYPYVRGGCATLEDLYYWWRCYRGEEEGVVYGVAPFPQDFAPATKKVVALECLTNEYHLQDAYRYPMDRYEDEREVAIVFNLDAVVANKANIADHIHFAIEATRDNIQAAIAGKDVINLLDGKPFNYRAWIKAQLAVSQEYGAKTYWPDAEGKPTVKPGCSPKR